MYSPCTSAGIVDSVLIVNKCEHCVQVRALFTVVSTGACMLDMMSNSGVEIIEWIVGLVDVA